MLELKIKSLFFDRSRVTKAVDRAKRAVLSRAGAYVRTEARHSIRPRRGVSRPGQPPHSHVGLLRRFILFGYEPASAAVVVGPVRLNKATDAPHTLEFGGRTVVTRTRNGRVVRYKARVAPRPYMGPALERVRPKLAGLWAGSVKGG